MSVWMDVLNTKQTETDEIKSTRHSAHSSAFGGGTKQANRRQKRLRKHSGNTSLQIAAGKLTTIHNKAPGLLHTLRGKLTGAANNSVRYVALKQTDLERGSRKSNTQSLQDFDNYSETSNTSNSSSEEDLFVTNSKRQQRRKMTRKGTYSMRETFENSRQVSNF